MKLISILVLTLLVAAIAPLRAEEIGGISGFVVNHDTGAKVANATLTIAPVTGAPWTRLNTGSDGFFSDVTLAPGRYFVLAMNPNANRSAVCAVVSVMPGETTRLKFEIPSAPIIGATEPQCKDLPYSPLVDPNQTADLFHM